MQKTTKKYSTRWRDQARADVVTLLNLASQYFTDREPDLAFQLFNVAYAVIDTHPLLTDVQYQGLCDQLLEHLQQATDPIAWNGDSGSSEEDTVRFYARERNRDDFLLLAQKVYIEGLVSRMPPTFGDDDWHPLVAQVIARESVWERAAITCPPWMQLEAATT